MTRRNKQISYGVFYLVCWVALFYGIYIATIKPPASCFDNKLNQDEVEVDCGGALCESCAIRHLLPLRIASVTMVPTGLQGMSSAVVEFQNPNPNYGATSFQYRIEFFTSSENPAYVAEGEAFIYPSEVKQRALVNLPLTAGEVIRHAESISEVAWKSGETISQPNIQTRELKMVVEGNRAVITGIVRNNSAFPILSAAVNGFVEGSGAIVGVSRTSLQDVVPTEERFFQLIVPIPAGANPASLTPRVSVEAKR